MTAQGSADIALDLRINFGTFLEPMPEIRVLFFKSAAGNEPVREWLRGLPLEQRKAIGEDLMVVQFRWPLGMPLVRKLAPDLWELRSTIPDGIARVFFTIWQDAATGSSAIIALHGFVKKSQKTPDNELATAKRRLAEFTRNTP